ncbi:MAG: ABC transporter substrate-binding protein [Cyanobacteria bacterium P01_D01_bin.36]
MKRSFLLAVLLLGGLLWLPGCAAIFRNDTSENSELETAERSGASVLRLLYSRTFTTLNPHLASGFQDFEASRVVYEPLATYEADGSMVPVLAELIPTSENGGVSDDGRTVTWKLKPDVRWSDGRPFTAEDVAFTYEFVSNPRVGAVTEKYYEAIDKVDVVDPLTVKITFKAPNPSWALPFTGQNGMILPKHIFEDVQDTNVRQAEANFQPVGTGPYRFIAIADDIWTFAANEQFREGTPAFDLVELEGGITPYVAARRVLRDGDADFVHNIQLSIEDRVALAKGGAGRVATTFGAYVERIMLNPTDPNEVTKNGERSSLDNPHPFLSNVNIRKAIDLAIDREEIVDKIYGNAGQLTNQLLPFPTEYTNPELAYNHDLEQAKKLLDAAGWIDTNDNGIRDKDGVEMRMVFQTPINPVRQRTQELVEEDLREVGIDVDIRRVIADDFFSADPSQTRSINHFYADMQKYNAGSDTPDPAIYMSWWLCDEIATYENNWQKPNNARYCNEEYDKLWEQASKELDTDKRAALFRQMNTLLMQDVAVIPLIRRANTNAISNRITGVDPTPWDASTWDIGTWKLASEAEAETPEVEPTAAPDESASPAETAPGSEAPGSEAPESEATSPATSESQKTESSEQEEATKEQEEAP